MSDWQVWVLLAIALALAEIFLIPAQFVLLALGVAALAVGGVVVLFDPSLSAQLAIFAVVAIVLVPLFVRRWRQRHIVRYAGTAGESGHVPMQAKVVSTEPLAISLKGDRFPASADPAFKPSIGEAVRVHGFDGITARIAPLAGDAGNTDSSAG